MGCVLAVIGPRKSGKSSLINAMLGKTLLATGQLMGLSCNVVKRGIGPSYRTCGSDGDKAVDRTAYLMWAGASGREPGAYANISCPFPRTVRHDVLIESFWGSTVQPEELYEAQNFIIVAHPFGLAAEDIRTSALFFDNLLAIRQTGTPRVYLTGRFETKRGCNLENDSIRLLAATLSNAIGIPCQLIGYGSPVPCR